MSSDEDLPDIPYCPIPAKKNRTDGEEDFLRLQSRVRELLAIPTKDRSDNERKEYNRLRNKYSKDKKTYSHLVEERAAATGAQRKAASRERMTEEERVQERDEARDRMAQPEAVAAARERMAQPEAVAAARERMAQPAALAADRVRKAQPEAQAATR